MHEEPDLSRLPHALHELVRLCLAKNPEDRPGTAWLIEAARSHPATGGELRFCDGWLPSKVSSEIHRHTDPPTTPPPPATVIDPVQAAAHAPTATARVLPAPAAATPQRPTPARRRTTTTARRGARTALLTAVALLLGAAATFALLNSGYLDDSDDQDATTTSSLPPSTASTPPQPTTAPGYTTAYTNRELTSPDQDHEFDLKAGKVTQDTSTWYLGRQSGAFYIPDDSDAYIPPAGPLTLSDCLKGIDTQPTSTLPFTTLHADRDFCVRAHGGQDIAIIQTLTTASDNGPVTVSITYYHRSAAA